MSWEIMIFINRNEKNFLIIYFFFIIYFSLSIFHYLFFSLSIFHYLFFVFYKPILNSSSPLKPMCSKQFFQQNDEFGL